MSLSSEQEEAVWTADSDRYKARNAFDPLSIRLLQIPNWYDYDSKVDMEDSIEDCRRLRSNGLDG